MSDLVKLTGMWANKTANGDTYFSGSIGSARLVMFANNRRPEKNDPDWILYVSPMKKREDAPDPVRGPVPDNPTAWPPHQSWTQPDEDNTALPF